MCAKTPETPGPTDTGSKQIATLSRKEREALVAELTPMVRATANRVARRVPRHVDVDDLLSAGMIGLFDAIEKFDRAKATDFNKYAAIRVKGAILDELRAQDPMTRATRKKVNELDRTSRGLAQSLGRTPTEHELASHLSMDPERLRELKEQLEPVLFTSMEALAQDGIDVTSFMSDAPSLSALDLLEQKDMRDVIEREISGLRSDRQQLALRFCFFDGMSNREIAKVLDISESRASQLLSEGLDALSKRLVVALRQIEEQRGNSQRGRLRGVRWQIARAS